MQNQDKRTNKSRQSKSIMKKESGLQDLTIWFLSVTNVQFGWLTKIWEIGTTKAVGLNNS